MIAKFYVIKNSDTSDSYDVYERFSDGCEKLSFIGFSKEDYNISSVKRWLASYYSGKRKIKYNQIIDETY